MNAKNVVIVLVVVCVGLAGGLLYRHSSAVSEKKKDEGAIQTFSNELAVVSTKLEEQKVVNLSLERDVATQAEEIKRYSNTVANLTTNLAKTQTEAKAAAEASKAEILQRDAKIAELESERDGLSKKMTELNGSISTLENQIADTQRKLEASEGDREFLLKELKRLQAEKAELERQFNDLALLREQVRKLRDELSIARRLDWIRRGLYGNLMKGGEKLQKGFVPPAPKTNFNLDVELSRDGSVKIAPKPANNSPAESNAAQK